MNRSLYINNHFARALTLLLLAAGLLCGTRPLQAADSVSDKVSAATEQAGKEIQGASQAAESKIQELWRRIDEQRLKHRTPDQIVAWIIMGLLAGGLIHQISNLNKFATLLLGLVGAFIGGIVANLTGIDMGLGPVLIRYEELLASLLGGLLIVLGARLLASRRAGKK